MDWLVLPWVLIVCGFVGYLFFSPAAVILDQISSALSFLPPVKWIFWWPVCIAAFFVLGVCALLRAGFRLDELQSEDDPGWYAWGQVIEMMFLPWIEALGFYLRGGEFSVMGLRLVMLNLAGPAFLFAVPYAILVAVWNPDSDSLNERVAKIVILGIAAAFYSAFYAGLWLSGNMGDEFEQLSWHVVAVISGIGTWRDYIRHEDLSSSLVARLPRRTPKKATRRSPRGHTRLEESKKRSHKSRGRRRRHRRHRNSAPIG